MPAIIEMRLRAERPYQPTTRQLHGLACALFEGASSEGHLSHEKPFAAWPLSSVPEGWLLRASWLSAGLPRTLLAACGQLRLGPVAYAVTDLAFQPASYADLAAGPAITVANLTLSSPAYFAQNGMHVVVPDPRLIVGSWRRRWNASLPPGDDLAIDDGQWRDVYRALTLSEFNLHTEQRDTGHGRKQAGFAGSLTLRLDRSAPIGTDQVFGALVRFSEYCGTGALTTHGFGATSLDLGRGSGQRLRPVQPGRHGAS